MPVVWQWRIEGFRRLDPSHDPENRSESGTVTAELAGEVLAYLSDHGLFWGMQDENSIFIVTVQQLHTAEV